MGISKSALKDVLLDTEVGVPSIVEPSLENHTVIVGVAWLKWVFSPVMVTDNSCPCNALSGEMD